MAAPANTTLRSTFTGTVEAESINDWLTHMHPATAPAHAMFRQEQADSAKPVALMDDWPIDRTTSAASSLLTEAKAEAASASVSTASTPSQLFTRMQTFHEGVAASRTSQRVKLYGIEDPMDRSVDRALIKVMDHFERAFHYGIGIESANPRTHGLITWAAATGLERRHGTNPALTVVGDGLQAVLSKYWSSMYNAQGATLTRDMFYDQILSIPYNIGFQVDGAFVLSPPGMMKLFSDMPHVPGRGAINEREIPARDQALMDIITIIQTPAYGEIYLVPDRLLGVPGITIGYQNTAGGFTGGVGTVTGTVGDVIVDKTILAVMPSEFSIKYLDNISYKELSTDGDYAVGMVVAEKCLAADHLFGICGATRVAA